ncbi:major facilitator superfamily transporter [Xylariales sp. AK1849]|nr:major facilitator superfamily transporter [Xylariales sp. AK1849]
MADSPRIESRNSVMEPRKDSGERCADTAFIIGEDPGKPTEVPPDAPKSEAGGRMSGMKNLIIWLAIALAVLCTFVDEGIIATAIPRITDQFHSLPDVGWYGSAYQMTLCAFQPVFGRLYNQFNKTIFLASLAIFEIGSFICGLSPTSVVFIVGRAIAGCGGAGLQSGSLVLISATLPADKLPLYVSGIGVVYGIAAVVGPVVGGMMTNSYLTWRWCFYINLPVAILPAAAIIVMVKLPSQAAGVIRPWTPRIRELDYLGMLLLLPCITSFILALELGGALYTWNDGRTIACFAVAGVLLFAFMAEQWWMGEKALVPLRIMKMRIVIFGAIYAFCIDAALFTLVYYIPLWFQAVQGASPEESGIRYLATCVAFIVTIFLGGWAVTELGYVQPFMLAGTLLLAVGSGLMSTLKASSGADRWIPYQVIAGLGIGFATQMPVIAMQSFLPKADEAIGVAIVMFCQCFGPTTFISISNSVFASFLTAGIMEKLPGIDPALIRETGTGDSATLLDIYNDAVTRTFLVAAVMAAISLVGLAGFGWKKIPSEGDDAAKKDEENLGQPPGEGIEMATLVEGSSMRNGSDARSG